VALTRHPSLTKLRRWRAIASAFFLGAANATPSTDASMAG
jgi:hypothetical protein